MARIRSTKPEFWLDRKLARKLTRDERMLYMGLWNQADEHGRALGDPVVVKGAVFPYDDDLTLSVIDAMLTRLDSVGGVVQRYEVDGDPYLFLPKLKDHQRLEPNKSKSKHPEPPVRDAAAVVSVESAPSPGAATVFSDRSEEPPPEFDNEPATFEPDQSEHDSPRTATIFSDESAQVPGNKSLLYGTGSMEQGGVSQTRPRETKAPPKPSCDNHPDGTPEPCGPCAGARKRWIAFNLERDQTTATIAAEREAAERERARLAAEDRARAIAECPLRCVDGWLDGRICEHNPNALERDRAGIAKARIGGCRVCDDDGLLTDGSLCEHRTPGKGRASRSSPPRISGPSSPQQSTSQDQLTETAHA